MVDPSSMTSLLQLEAHGPDVFVGLSPDYGNRVYGGLAVAQALWAAAATVDDEFHPHSLHAYFIRGGSHAEPLRYEIDRIRNGRSFATRRVVARQSSGAIFNLSASFHRDEPQADIQVATLPDVPDPETLDDMAWLPAFHRRPVPGVAGRRIWVKTKDTPPNPVGAACALAYASDDFPMNVIRQTNPRLSEAKWSKGEFMGASLDHSLWFHRPIPIDQWLLFDLHSTGVAGARGLTFGEVFTSDGIHVASMTQEVLIREHDPELG